MAIQATIIGNLGADARVVTLGQTQALEFNVASRRSRKDKNGQPQTDWIECIFFRTALQPYLTKGRTVVVMGELETHTYTTQTGEVRVGMKVVANNIDFAGGPQDTQPMQSQPQPQQQAYQQPMQPATQQPQQPQTPPPSGGGVLPC